MRRVQENVVSFVNRLMKALFSAVWPVSSFQSSDTIAKISFWLLYTLWSFCSVEVGVVVTSFSEHKLAFILFGSEWKFRMQCLAWQFSSYYRESAQRKQWEYNGVCFLNISKNPRSTEHKSGMMLLTSTVLSAFRRGSENICRVVGLSHKNEVIEKQKQERKG